MLASLRGLLRKWGSFPFLLSLTLIATDCRGEAFFFLFFFTTEISYLIIGLWHLLEPIPLWRENSLCAAQLKPLQFVNLPLLVPGPPGGEAWCAVSDSDSLHPRGQTTGWGESNAMPPCSTSTKTRNECSHGISQWLFDMLTHQWCFEFCQGDFVHMNPQIHLRKVQ